MEISEIPHISSRTDALRSAADPALRSSPGTAALWMVLDGVTVLGAAILAGLRQFRMGPQQAWSALWRHTLFQGHSLGFLAGLLLGFALVLVLLSHRWGLYSSSRPTSLWREQALSFEVCLAAGLLLTAAVYLAGAQEIPREFLILTVSLVTVSLGFRRLLDGIRIRRRFARGMDTRNVLIVGTGVEAQALRHHLEGMRYLGYRFKGFVSVPEFESGAQPGADGDAEVVGTLETLFQTARKQFVDEILLTVQCAPEVVDDVLEQARSQRVDLRVIPGMVEGVDWNSPVEYIGQFPTVPLHWVRVPEAGLVLKRAFDLLFSAAALFLLLPVMLAVALAIKVDSPGPVFYLSERIGKKGRVFHCIKFRTMVADAERRRAEVMHMNERDGVLFKIANDPRITRLGHFLRKFSLDELPQFLNTFRGDMSVVGPRPPLKSEVRQYKLDQLRRLDVTPGITGLWQVVGRKDPSFDTYVNLDVAYIEKWSLWLDVKIILRTIAVVVAGTGT